MNVARCQSPFGDVALSCESYTEVHWLEQSDADVPAQNDWLSASEEIRLDGLRFAKRRADWRLGRWTAKRAVARCLNLPGDSATLARLEIRPAPDGAPEAFLAEQAAPVVISLSHRAGHAVCAVAPAGTALGCDLEVIEPRSAAFAADYFAPDEQALIARAPPADRERLLTLVWSAKESALKALREGLRLDTRCVIVDLTDGPGRELENEDTHREDRARTLASSVRGGGLWRPLQVCYDRGRVFRGWWQSSGELVRTVVADPPAPSPTLLTLSHPAADIAL
ncbi:MAG TPA: 4'-phosphopantetheinyl transferase superfamily protein [Terriglobia bacterium]|nr:4'-phosphopantetheinyl transferase superfamily protein [Terriglobia bacterium]